MSNAVDISGALRSVRERLGISRQSLAAQLGTSLAAVSRWESGTAFPSPEVASQILDLRDETSPRAVVTPIFASRGVRKHSEEVAQVPIELLDAAGSPVLDRIRNGALLTPAGNETFDVVLARHSVAALVTQEPPRGGMSAGKNTYTYDAHTYHTKVPPQGIAELLRHYLPEGGLVLDPFAGSGMTGVAASIVGADCVLNELSPAATFISSRFASRVAPGEFEAAAAAVLKALEQVRRDLYTTECRECGQTTELLYTVWSYRVQCNHCGEDFQLWDHCRSYGRTVREHKILTEFPCPGCGVQLAKSRLPRSVAEPVEIGYKCCGSRQREVNHAPSAADVETILRIGTSPILGALGAPADELPDGVNLGQPKRHGLTSVDKFYTPRNLSAMSHLWSAIHRIPDPQLAAQVTFAFTGLYRRVTRFSEFRFWGGSGNSARLNVPYIFDEANVFVAFERKVKSIIDHLASTATEFQGDVVTHVGSATDLSFLPDKSVDLVFTDPPFGANINYSEMNLLWEAWLGTRTDTTNEAIVNKVQGKDNAAYGRLMADSLKECHRVLRDGSWMLLVFMNSSAAIWEELRNAIELAGFTIESADVFDKQHGTFKHFVSPNTPGADLVLHCRKLEASPAPEPRPDAPTAASEFIKSTDLGLYKTAYLHVDRADELDYRRLYSDWLADALVARSGSMSFPQFRQLVDSIAMPAT